MTTYSGRKFDPMQMTPGDVYIEDIAHALSLLCRGGGQLTYFYSVGQHSLNCAAEAKARGWSKRQQLACLLHDASEGYISDIIRPVKIYLTNYLEIESKIMGTILTHFGLDDLTEEENLRWKQIDDEILELELKTLLHGEENRAVPQFFPYRIWRSIRRERSKSGFYRRQSDWGYTEVIVEKKPERNYSTTVMYILAYLDRYGYPVLILIAGALADFYRGRITMLFVLAVGILLDGIYNLVGYLCRWRHIYLCYQSMCHTKMTPSRIEWDRMTKKDAYGIPAAFIIGGIIGILVSIFLR